MNKFPRMSSKDTADLMKSWESHYLEQRIILISGEVDTDMADGVVHQLLFLSSVDPEEPITLLINSPGGSVYDGLGIIDTMNLIPNPIVTIVNGMAMSMACAIAVHGTKGNRYVTANATMMDHSISSRHSGTIHDLEIDMKETQRLNSVMDKMIAKALGLPLVKYLKQRGDRDKYLSAEDAVRLGYADEILTRKRGRIKTKKKG